MRCLLPMMPMIWWPLRATRRNYAVRKDIVSQLAVMHNKEATDYMVELLNK